MASQQLPEGDRPIRSAPDPVDLRFTKHELEDEAERIKDFLRDHIPRTLWRIGVEMELDTAVVGISGGVDSALVAHLAADALGPENVHGLLLPNEVTDPEAVSDAERVAEDLGIAYDVVEIGPIVDAVLGGADATSLAAERPDEFDALLPDVTSVRLRSLLEHVARIGAGGVVVGTSVRSEWLTGHFDPHGDAAVDLQPILHLYKTQVHQLARFVGVPDSIVERPPDPDFRALGTDEENYGVDYETLDAVLALHVDGGLSAGRTADVLGVDRSVVETVRKFHDESREQRSGPPSLEPPTERP